jgi:hypothetical protein
MSPSLISKIVGWGQFVFTALANTFQSGGFPSNPLSWIMTVMSLGTAISVHAAGKTDGDTVGVGVNPPAK